ncbi:MAG: SixA phosphatase family protein [Gaiellaceae bacterium]
MRVFLVRHAEAAPGEPDELRPLTDAGGAAARALGEQLAAERPTAVFSSPLLRARETADAIAHAAGLTAQPDERLGPGATAEDVRSVALGETVVVVGHQPDCSEIVLALTGREVRFAPGAVHEVELP